MEITLKNGNRCAQYFSGNMDEDSISFIFRGCKYNFSREVLNFIDSNWDSVLLNNPRCYNGKLYNILDIVVGDNRIDVIYDMVDYKTVLATRNDEYKKFNNSFQTNHLSVAGILKTSDNKILIGSDLSFKNGLQSWKFPGGFFDAEKDKSILNCLYRECEEEIGSYTFMDIKIINISKNLSHNFTAIICLAALKETSADILEYNIKNKNAIIDNYEMQTIKFIEFNKHKIQELLDCELISLSPTTLLGLNELMTNHNLNK